MDNKNIEISANEVFGVISKQAFGEIGCRDVQTNSAWSENPYGDEYAVIPEDLIDGIVATCGFCDIDLNEEGTEVISFTAREIPENLIREKQPTTEERLEALERAMLEQIGVVTE